MSLKPIGPGTVLLHIGPHKTGTTALQSGAASRRAQLAAQGIAYPGKKDHHSAAALGVGGRRWGWIDRGGHQVSDSRWAELVDEVALAPDKVFLSSEFFAELSGEHLERVVGDLGPERTHVAVTLRPLAKIVPSFWQQSLKGGSTRTYDAFLEAVLPAAARSKTAETFWAKQDHGAVIERWAAAVGPENVTVVVVDERNHALLPRTFEAILGLSEGLLDPPADARTNRSMTAAECEVLRQVNEDIRQHNVQWPDYSDIIRYGAVTRMVESRRPGPDERPLITPRWALDRCAELGVEAAAIIKGSGVRVVGDLERLGARPWADQPDPGPAPAPTVVPLDDAVDLVVGALAGAVGAGAFFSDEDALERPRKQRSVPPRAPGEGRGVGTTPVNEVAALDLVRVVGDRVVRRARQRLRRS